MDKTKEKDKEQIWLREMDSHRILKNIELKQMNKQQEEWKQIDGFIKYYVSDKGNVMNMNTERVLTKAYQETGHCLVCLSENNKVCTKSVAKLVLSAFDPIPDAATRAIIFKDGDKRNCKLDNLEWAEVAYINKHKKIPREIKELMKEIESLIEKWYDRYKDLEE